MKCLNKNIRLTVLEMVKKSRASHIGSALSMIEIINCVYESVDLVKIRKNSNDRDRIILSKGHGTSALYAVLYHHDLLKKNHIENYFSNGSEMAGHASHFVDYVEHSTGALGHGLSVGLGLALGSKSKGYQNKIYVIVGDGELHEGSNWEAIMYAGYKKLNNLIVLVDNNKKSQLGDTSQACDLNPLDKKFEAFNFKTINVKDGHNENEITKALNTIVINMPVAIICNTIKGKGISFMEDDNLWHYRPPAGDDYEKAIKELIN